MTICTNAPTLSVSFDSVNVSGVLPNGSSFETQIPLLDGGGLVLSKCESMRSPKRERDAFDVYLMLTDPQRAETVAEITTLCREFPNLRDIFSNAWTRLTAKKAAAIFDENVRQYWRECKAQSPAADVVQILRTITQG